MGRHFFRIANSFLSLFYSLLIDTTGEEKLYAALLGSTTVDSAMGIYVLNNLITKVISKGSSVTEFKLKQNFPNPFNPTTTIIYALPTDELVVLKIYDILGREVTTLVNEIKQAGTYSVSFNASNLASGIYFYTISAGNFHQTKKMLLIR